MSDDTARYLKELADCGWFEALPAAAAEAARQAVIAAAAEGEKPWRGLVCATPDSAYLLEDLPYTALLGQFAQATYGAFDPESIREEAEKGAIRLSFRAAGRDFVRSLPADAFDVSDSFFETINDALEASGSGLRFLQLRNLGWGPIPGFTLTTPAAFGKAAAARLIAATEPSDASDEELAAQFDEISARTTASFMARRQTFYWTLDGLTVLEITVPDGYLVEDTDARKKREGLMTILGYERVGTLMLQCAAPIGDHAGLPKGFKTSERLERQDRLVVRGTAKLAGVDVAWRQDTFRGLPLHLTFCVTTDRKSQFAEALDSARVLDGSPEREALFQSCLAPAPPNRRAAKRRPG
jgi:hypothetical protein